MAQPKLRFKREDGTGFSEWEELTLGNRFTFKNGINASREAFRAAGIHCIGVSDVIKCLPILATNVIGTVSISDKEVENNKVNYGDILFQRSSETQRDIGHASVYIDNTSSVYNGFVICGKPEKIFYNPIFLHNALQIYKVRKQTISLGAGAQHYNIGQEGLAQIKVNIPCLEEQKRIADFLSAIDEVIVQSEAEIQNLEQQKKAVVQKIFSQEVRFRREDGTSYPEWKNATFSEIFSAINNNTFSRDMLSKDGTVCNIHYGDILVKFGEVCDIQTADIPKVNANIDTDKYEKLKDGDIIIADTAEDETVGKAIEIYRVGANEVVSGLHTMACRPNSKFASKYLGYYINSPSYHNQLIPFMQGIKVTSIGRKNIASTVIYYPASLEEQRKIADFLSVCDEAITYAKQELSKWKELKKGLLQQMFV